MSIINKINFLSRTLMLKTDVNVLVSDKFNKNKYYNVLFLLHGFSGDCNSILHNTKIASYIDKTSTIVVMPSGYNSYYFDGALKINSFIANELPVMLSKLFDLKFNEDSLNSNYYIAGFSMGGFGALKIGLQNNTFGGIASVSGVIDIKKNIENISAQIREEKEKSNLKEGGTKHMNWLQSVYSSLCHINDTQPEIDFEKKFLKMDRHIKLYVSCGMEDYLYQDNRDFISSLKNIEQSTDKITLISELTPMFGHDWDYWDIQAKNLINWVST